MRNISFKAKLITTCLLIGLIPTIVVSSISYFSASKQIEKEVAAKLVAIEASKKIEVGKYLETIKKQMQTYSSDPSMQDAAVEFVKAYNNIETKVTPEMKASVLSYYNDQFNKKFKDEVGTSANIDALTSTLAPKDWVMQYAFISNNKHALGEKHNLMSTDVLPKYSEVHKKFHPSIAKYLEKFEYYDIFIIDKDTGRIVYSVFKELDYSTSLKDGPYKDSNLAKVYNKAMSINDQKSVAFVDFKKYLPSYQAPASFIAAPIWKDGVKVGILAFQMPVGAINDLMAQSEGMGETGEIYLVGDDNLLRSDTRMNKDLNIVNSFRKNLKVESTTVKSALSGKVSSGTALNYEGKEVFFASNKVSFEGSNWAIISEITSNEVLSGLHEMRKNMFLFTLGVAVVVLIVGLFVSRGLSHSVSSITESLSKSSHEVQNSSHALSMASEKLKSSVDSQSGSIHQTASAIDEITSMLDRSSSSSVSARKLSSDTKESALQGVNIVENMMKEMHLISESYDEISESVQNNNKDISEIVNVISEISEKTAVINDIVFQTKLLSFNASVEAARAGEHGKGFAVVAEEVGNLASMSGKAADEIMGMLNDSISKVNEIAEKTQVEITGIVNNGRGQVEKGSGVATECRDRLSDINKSISELDGAIEGIVSAAQEQKNGVKEIENAVRSLEESTMVSKSMSETTDNSAEKLLNQSRSLREDIEKLRVFLGTKNVKNITTEEKLKIVENDEELAA